MRPDTRRRRCGVAAAALAAVVSGGASNVTAMPGAPGPAAAGRWHGVHGARQVITVTARHADTARATVRAYDRTAHGWTRVAGPWRAWIGRSGFAARGRKREGDGATPSGSFAVAYFFGAMPRPAVHYRWRHARRTSFWDDDPASPRYNEWVDSRRASPGRNPEPLHVRPSYDAAAVIDYNPSRTPYLGSGIFLHITHHSATSGCVALPRRQLLWLLRWLRPAKHPRILMGTTASVT